MIQDGEVQLMSADANIALRPAVRMASQTLASAA
jgi:hypothetical protein